VNGAHPASPRAPLCVPAEEYSVEKCLRDGPASEIWSAVRQDDGRAVVLKVYARDRDQPRRDTWIHAESEILRSVAGKGIPAVLEILDQNPPVLVLERVPGIPLAEWLEQHREPDAATFVEIALQLSDVLSRVHAAHIVHRDVNPANILIEPRTLAIHLIDFGIAQPRGALARRASRSARRELAGTPLYIAPEQTGWMNRDCDSRSDLYSLGATLYHVLTGRTPFEGATPVELIHAQIARTPVDPLELRPDVPALFARLVLRLLRKEPEERYQSARALRNELLALREQLAQHGSVDPRFELGSAEAPDRPRFLRTVHGRAAESARLELLLARASEGEMHAVVIRGEAGVGKSALVDALRPRIVEARGYLALGKFELGRERPYGAWIAVVESLAQQILIESDARLERWREELRAGLGNIARVLVDLVPDLGVILGDVPAVPPLGSSETQARFALALQRLLRAYAAHARPLAIFLDDLQWSDAGSRFVLEELLSGESLAGLLLIVAHRADAVVPGHPITELLERLAVRGVALHLIELQPLGRSPMVAMLAEALGRTPQAIEPLAALIERKTANLPLLVRQFVEHIHERELLRYEPGTGWSWDGAQIAAADIPDGAVALMTAKIDRLEPASRAVLQFASCVGTEFDVELLCELERGERTELVQQLYDLCDAGLLAPSPSGFRFTHDRIREAAQGSLSESERARLHYETARLLLARTPEAERAARALELVEHLNLGLACVGEQLRTTVIQLNLVAGERTMAAGAAATAGRYFAVARSLFGEDDWERDHGLGLTLHLQSAESAFQCGELAEAQRLLDALDRRGLSRLELAQVVVKRLHVLALTREPEDTASYTLSVLRSLGISWPLHPSALRVRWAMRGVLRLLSTHDPDTLLRRATQLDPEWIAPLLLLSAGGSALLRVDIHLAALASCHAMRCILKYGYLARPGFSLAVFAYLTHTILGDAERARRLATLALDWSRRVPDALYGPRAQLQLHVALEPWLMPRREALRSMPRVAEDASEVGDPEFANYARFLERNDLALAGDPVAVAEQRMRELAEAVARSGHRYPAPAECSAVLGLLVDPGSVPLEQVSAEARARLAAKTHSAEPHACTLWLMVLCVYGRYDLALAQSDALGARLFQVVPYVHVADHTFYRGLACAALASEPAAPWRRLRADLRRCLRRLRRWAKHGPDFVHMASFLEAELARLAGDESRARALYDAAAQRALEQRFVHHAALAHERRASMLVGLRRETEASASLARAVALYREWGAEPKAQQLLVQRRS
jgi:predicted ATPase